MSPALTADADAPPLDPAPPTLQAADDPTKFSPRSWLRIGAETVQRTLHNRAPSTAAAAAFYAFLAFVPGIAAFGCLFGLFAGPEALRHQLNEYKDLVPAGVLGIVQGEAVRFAGGDRDHLLPKGLLFFAVALVSATSGVRALMGGLNTAYRVEEHRHWVRRRMLALVFAAGFTLASAAQVALVLRSGDYLSREPDILWPTLRLIGRWLSLFAISVAALALLYRYGPDRRRARWRWVTPGSMVAAAVGLLTSAGTSIYLAHFANYERTYGGLGSVLALVVWLWASMIVVLAGAELNCAMECATSAVTDVSGRRVDRSQPPG